MAAPVSAALICSKCGAQGAPGQNCAKCGGPLVKVCGGCGTRNSPAKNYCDRCGSAMALAPVGHPPEQREPPPPSASEPPLTAIRRMQPPPVPESFQLPEAGRVKEHLPVPTEISRDIPALGGDDPNASMTVMKRKDRLKNAVWLLVLAIFGAFALAKLAVFMRPEYVVPRRAAKYLNHLRNGEFASAYHMLSQEAQKHVSVDEFSTMRDSTPWSWSDIKVIRSEPGAVVVKYTLSLAGQPPREDLLQFVKEDGLWVRPYNWTLLQKAENALERNDPDLAGLLAKAAVDVNPRDPMARAYLCEAVFYKRVPADTARECELALKLHDAYPSKLSTKSLYHIHALLGDTYKNALRRYPEALREYNTLLSFPELTAADRCRLLTARAETLTAMGRAAEAAADQQSAQLLCREPVQGYESRLEEEGAR